MDEDENQDEPIRRSNGKRTAQWVISDSEEDVEEESGEGESADDSHLDGEEEEEEDEGEEEDEKEDDDEDDEEDGDAEVEAGGVGGTSAGLAGMSSDEDADNCPICLNSFSSQPVATPENCEHYFCLDCILQWAKNANSCPVDRIAFDSIYLRKCYGGKTLKMITVQKPVKEGQEEIVDLDLEQTNCEVCGGSDREDRLLLCDGCDAGYHMECLTPPLDSVPVEEWFCPECEANNRRARNSAEEISEPESLPSTARASVRHRPQPHATGPTRAIARTQQSERVRASVNRHRITQARSSQLAPTYLIQSTWLDETINAVVAGLNTAVYVRDLTPRGGTRRVRKRRKTTTKKTNAKTGKSGVRRRRKRKVRKTKSRKKVAKKAAGPRSRIASNLGIVKDKKGSSLPTVYRPSEHTLSSMRVDIGAASLSIYGDPFDLDPFVEREEEEHQDHVTSLLEAKRRGISRSALRSHQPVARPVTASLSRRGMDVPRSVGVVEAAPVPDLLGSILSGQSMLLMDSSHVVINRDGSLKAAKPAPSNPHGSISGHSGDSGIQLNPQMSPITGDLPGSSHNSINRSSSSTHLPSATSSTASSAHSPLFADFPPGGHSSLQSQRPNRLAPSSGVQGANPLRATRESPSSSNNTAHDSSSKSRRQSATQVQPIKAVKPTWVDVSVLPKIPKLKRDTSDGPGQDGRNGHSSRNDSTCASTSCSKPVMGINSLAGDKSRQQSIDKQKGRFDGQAARHRPGEPSSSPAFSYSFSSSNSSTGSNAGQPRYSSSSSSTSSVSFRINSSGNSWHSRRLNTAASSAREDDVEKHWKKREDEAKKRQLHRDKQMLLASHALVNKEQDTSNIYDPFDPTMSDSSDSDNETETSTQDEFSQSAAHGRRALSIENKDDIVQKKENVVHVKTETVEVEVSEEPVGRADMLGTVLRESTSSGRRIKIEKDSVLEAEKQTSNNRVFKEEPHLDKAEEDMCVESNYTCLKSEPFDWTLGAHHGRKAEKTTQREEHTHGRSSSTCKNETLNTNCSSTPTKPRFDSKQDSKSSPKSPKRDMEQKQTSRATMEEPPSSENERSRVGDDDKSESEERRKDKKDKERSSRRSRSRERRRRTRSSSQSSDSESRCGKKRQRSRSWSNDRKQSRSSSRSSSREHSRKKKHRERRKERTDERRDHNRGRKERRGRSCSKSSSRSRSSSRLKSTKRERSSSKSQSRSRSRERRTDFTCVKQKSSLSGRGKDEYKSRERKRHKSRSSSRERKPEDTFSSKSLQRKSVESTVSSSKPEPQERERKKGNDAIKSSNKEKKHEVPGSSRSSHKTPEVHSSSSGKTTQLQERKKEKASVKDKKSKGEGSSKSSQNTSGSCVASAEGKTELKDIKKEDGTKHTVKDRNEEKGKKHQVLSPTSSCTVKKERKSLSADVEPTTEVKLLKEIKKEDTSFDMFVDVPVFKPIKKEDMDFSSLPETQGLGSEGVKQQLMKTEPCEIKVEACEIPIKSEPSSPKSSHQPSHTVFTPAVECQQDAASHSPSGSSVEEEPSCSAGTTVPLKQEAQQGSDSDDDFNVDVMLDNLDYVKSEPTEASSGCVKKENEADKHNVAGEQAPAVAGAKSKSQVKRVTWNIQEPDASQPEKSASKVAMYKLKRRQEGVRKPGSTSSTQELTKTVGNSSRKDGVKRTSSRSDSLHPQGSTVGGQEEAGEVDTSMKDKANYLKKLHMQERAVEEVKLAIKPFYQKRDINKEEYKEILRKAVQKVCHSKSGEINPLKVGNLVKAYVDKYKHARKHRKGGEDSGKTAEVHTEPMKMSDSPQDS